MKNKIIDWRAQYLLVSNYSCNWLPFQIKEAEYAKN